MLHAIDKIFSNIYNINIRNLDLLKNNIQRIKDEKYII